MIEEEIKRLDNMHKSFELINSPYWSAARGRLFELLEERLSLLDIDLSGDPQSVVANIKANQIANKLITDWILIIESEAKNWVVEKKPEDNEDHVKVIS